MNSKITITDYAHQKEGLKFVQKFNSSALLMEMGTGKTRVMIHWVHSLKDVKRILLVSPNSILEKEKEEILKHSPFPEKDIIHISSGLKEKRVSLIKKAFEDSQKEEVKVWLIINYEGVVPLSPALLQYDPEVIVLDESTRIKNPRAQVTKALHGLGRFTKYKMILTGTPLTESPLDIWGQYHFLCPGLFPESFWPFRARYAIMGGYLGKQVVSYHNLPELMEKVYSIGFRILKKDCLDLPPKVYQELYYDLSPEQRRIYEELRRDLCAEVEGGIISVSQAVVGLLRLSQICSGFYRRDESEKETYFKRNPKLELLKEILLDLPDERLIIWTRFIPEIKQISKYLKKIGRSCEPFYGEIKDRERNEVLKRWKSSKNGIFLGQVRAGGFGLDLTEADKVIYYSNSYSLTDRLQSEDRSHRIGQMNKVTYLDLVGRGTLERAILRLLGRKQNLIEVLNKSNIRNIIGGEI